MPHIERWIRNGEVYRIEIDGVLMGLGDMVARVATPIARTLELPCIDPETNQLRPESRCNKSRVWLNDIGEAFYDQFFKPPTKKE